MPKHNPIFDRATVLHSLSKNGRRSQPFTPICAFDMPFDEHRIPLSPLLVNADRPSSSPGAAFVGLDGRQFTTD